MRNFFSAAVLASALLFSFFPVRAQDPAPAGPLVSEMSAFVVGVDEEGREKFTEAKTVEPGGVVEYRLFYRNVSESPLRGIRVVSPVAENTGYAGGSADACERTGPHFSIDGGATFHPEPVKYILELPGGGREERVAGPEMYTHLLWTLEELAAGEKVSLRYRVRVK